MYWERETVLVTEDGDQDIVQHGWTVEVYRHNIRFTGEFNPDSPEQVLTSDLLNPDELSAVYYSNDCNKFAVIENNKPSSWQKLEHLFW